MGRGCSLCRASLRGVENGHEGEGRRFSVVCLVFSSGESLLYLRRLLECGFHRVVLGILRGI